MHKCSQRACAQLTLPPARLQELISRAMDAFTELNLNRFGDDQGGGVILNEKAFSGQHVMAVLKRKKLKVFYFPSELAKDEATGTTDQVRALACACFCATHS